MTAEIAILNRNGVALAADSAGTLILPSGPKITNTMSKLFMLSKYTPVGIMVYGDSQLMQVPWETIIKTYREVLRGKSFEHLEDYGTDFIRFMEHEELLFPKEFQSSYAGFCLETGFRNLRQEIDVEVKRVISSFGSISDDQLKNLVREKSLRFLLQVEKSEYLSGFGADDVHRFTKDSEIATIRRAILGQVFDQVPIDEVAPQLHHAGALMLCNRYLDISYSGIVIAGFGDKDIFPALLHFECDGVVNKKLRHIEWGGVKIGTEFTGAITGAIRPFAQHEMVDRFVEGIDGQYRKFVEDSVSSLFVDKYAKQVMTFLDGKISPDVCNAASVHLSEIATNLNREFTETLDQYQKDEFAQSILNSVATLPKGELASMAEALVNLTAFKRKVSSDEVETVAAPIDVAIISKGDGFIWIKKKHYFEASLNPDFFRDHSRSGER